MKEWEDNKRKNACQIQFDDTDGQNTYKSLYLDTLGAAARRSPSPMERQQRGSCVEGYIHGPLSTAGIHGASPTHHSLTKQKQLLLAAAADPFLDLLHPGPDSNTSSCPAEAAAAASAAAAPEFVRPNLLGGMVEDPGMRPKVRIKASINRPDLSHTTADIEGAQPNPKDVCHHPRDTNPLNPHYSLATGSGLLQFPGGPVPPDRLLRNTLDISDIPGAGVRPTTPAGRVAAAKAAAAAAAAAAGWSAGSGAEGRAGSSASSSSSSRPGVLDVSDIEGACAARRTMHRRHAGASAHDSCLDVSDINSYMARFRPGPRNSGQYKGHPQGPRVPSPIRPRSNPATMDNSLRKFDIEGTSVRLAPKRATHSTCLDVADIEGTHPASRDRAQLYAARKGAAAAALAQQAAAAGALGELQLQPGELLLLWNECKRRDRDRSGLLTGQELLQAMQQVQVQLSPQEAQHLANTLQGSGGAAAVLNYKKLARQLKGRTSRPASAPPVAVRPAPAAAMAAAAAWGAPAAAAASPAQVELQRPGSAGQQLPWRQQQQRPQSAVPCAGMQQEGGEFAEQGLSCNTTTTNAGSSSRGGSRPASAPSRPRKQAASGNSSCYGGGSLLTSEQAGGACASSWARHGREGVSAASHWFAGSRRDAAAATETVQWRPGPAADALAKGWGLNGPAPWDPHTPFCGSSAGAPAGVGMGVECGGCEGGDGSVDVVPAWLIGGDAVYGTCKVSQPFGCSLRPATAATGAQGVGTGAAAVGVDQLLPAERRSLSRCGHRQPGPAAPRQRPASAGLRLGPGGAACGGQQQQQQQQQQLQGLAGARAVGSSGSKQCQQRQQQQQSSQRPASACQRGGHADLLVVAGSGRSSCRLGLAEHRRLLQSQQQDLLAVRMLT